MGYSSVCDDTAGCSITVSHRYGFLNANEASSVYCYCDQPGKFFLLLCLKDSKKISKPREIVVEYTKTKTKDIGQEIGLKSRMVFD